MNLYEKFLVMMREYMVQTKNLVRNDAEEEGRINWFKC